MSINLKPCPLPNCSGEGRPVHNPFQGFQASCKKCEWGTGIFESQEGAINNWNTRPISDQPNNISDDLVEAGCRAYMKADHPAWDPDNSIFEDGEPNWKLYCNGVRAVLSLALSQRGLVDEPYKKKAQYAAASLIVAVASLREIVALCMPFLPKHREHAYMERKIHAIAEKTLSKIEDRGSE